MTATEQATTLRYELRGPVAWIVLTRPERRNALGPEVIADLGRAVAAAREDDGVRVLVITGTDDAFSAGADLAFVRSLESPKDIVDRFLRPLTEVLRAIRELPKPVIAAINGHCVAGGLETALCCDLIVAAEDARIADGHARFGLLPAIGGAHLLSRALGPHKAKELLFTGDTFTGAQLAELGLVNRAVPGDRLEEAVTTLAESLAERSPSGLARMKEMVNDGGSVPWQLAAALELTLTEAHLGTGAPAEGLAAFAERRAPVFGPGQ
ncbi:enoyl-CoA hydratase/isomerase family protein [Streptomyces plumbiresistens]|uniref:Enoyl-CoA hydratase/isomerase family protein n=1 Tax=Streptomyces plumbiresistens TaxID=511811 RepID=A0ABP7TEX2_9ACTN